MRPGMGRTGSFFKARTRSGLINWMLFIALSGKPVRLNCVVKTWLWLTQGSVFSQDDD